ncbi:MAG: hypothetical protein H6706_26210 [Myxococcales bacterium]|nr:hypothetical protein [Myxococcales bacterium]
MGARKRVAWLGGSALIASPALADWPPYIGGGYVYSQVWGDAPTSGHGLELTYGQSDPFGGLAAVLQHDWYLDDSTRLALGGQVNGPGIGLELAWSRRDDDRGTTHGIQVAPFATLMGTVYVSGRFVFAVGDGPHGDERGFAIGLKFPYLLGDLNVGFGHGRPLRGPGGRPIGVRGVCLPAPVRVALDAPTRQALGAAWLEDARMEHASVATFERLAGWLGALGAPEALVREARRAAADERRHAAACFDLAGGYLGRRYWPTPVEAGPTAPPSLAELAVDSLVEGCLGEGAAALEARAAAAAATEEGPRRALAVIAEDEARHAALAAHVVAWAEQRGGDGVRRAVADARRRLRLRGRRDRSAPTPPAGGPTGGWRRLASRPPGPRPAPA